MLPQQLLLHERPRLAACGKSGDSNQTDAGSSQSLCDRVDATRASLAEKAKTCPDAPVRLVDKAQCEAALSSCTDVDKTALGKALDCMGQVGTCDPAKSFDWVLASAACVVSNPLSQACQTAITTISSN
jgi:hypothetical protein